MSAQQVFRVAVLDPQGRIVQRAIHAANLEQARQVAANEGLTILDDAEPSHGRPAARLQQLLHPNRSIDTAAFCQDLATLMEAGLTVKEAVAVLARKEPVPTRKQILTRLNDMMGEGSSFSTCLEAAGCFPALLVATVAASEQTGDLATGLSRYAKHQDGLRTVRDRVVGACVYPALLLVVGSVVVVMLLGIVVPRFSRLMDIQGRDLPLLSQWLMTWGQFADAHPMAPMAVLALLAGCVVYAITQWKHLDARRRWLARIPGVAKVVREFQHLQMYRTAAILTARGIPIHRALGFTADLLSPTDRERLHEGLIQMREGRSISTALAGCGLTDVVAESMLGVAERSGAVSEMLDRVADFYERGLQRNIDIASRLIEPVLMIVFGFVIGGIVLLMYLPIFDLAASVG